MGIQVITISENSERKTKVVQLTGLDPAAVFVELTPVDGSSNNMHSDVRDGATDTQSIELVEDKPYLLRSYSRTAGTATPDESSAIGTDQQVWVDPPAGKLQVAPDLLALVAASLALPDSTPRKGCDGAVTLHTAWLQHLDTAYKATGVPVSDNAGAYETINGDQPKTSCSQTCGNALRNFGVPSQFLGGSPSTALVAFPGDEGKQRGYLRKITPTSLPRAGDLYYLVNSETNRAGSPKDHHAILGRLTGLPKDRPCVVGDYSGGQAPTGTKDKPTPKDKTDALFSKRTLIEKSDGIYAGGLSSPGAVGEGTTNFRRIMVYTDMWQFFQDNGAGIKDPGKRGSLK